jgi:hypothetical protein
LYGIKVRHEWLLPRFQFTEEGTVPGIEQILGELDPELHPLSVQRWFTLPDPDLTDEVSREPMSPLDWLRTGHKPSVVARMASEL